MEVATVEEAGQLVGPGLLGEQLAPPRIVIGQRREAGKALDSCASSGEKVGIVPASSGAESSRQTLSVPITRSATISGQKTMASRSCGVSAMM